MPRYTPLGLTLAVPAGCAPAPAPGGGRPTADTGRLSVAAAEVQGCPGDRGRTVTWGDLRLRFTDGPTGYTPAGRRHPFTYATGSAAGPHTAAGLSAGRTIGDLRTAYRTRARVAAGDEGDAVFRVRVPGGTISGTATGDDGVITLLEAGSPCEA